MKISSLFLLFALVFTAGKAQTFADTLLYEKGVENAYPHISADGKRILYQSNRSGNWHLYILDIASGNSTQLTGDSSHNNFPDWSADNQWIAFVSNRDGNENIYLMRSDGTDLKKIIDNPARDIHPYFSPDGQYILFNSTRGNGSLDIFRYTLADEKLEQLTSTRDNETCARYHPDMKKLVFLRNSELSDDVYTMDLTTGLTDNLTKDPYIMNGWPCFSPDGNWIYYSSLEKDIYSIYRVPAAGGPRQQVTMPAEGEEDARANIHPDGKHLIFNKRAKGSISILSIPLPS